MDIENQDKDKPDVTFKITKECTTLDNGRTFYYNNLITAIEIVNDKCLMEVSITNETRSTVKVPKEVGEWRFHFRLYDRNTNEKIFPENAYCWRSLS